MSSTAVRIEGGMFAPDLFDELVSGARSGQSPEAFGLDGDRLDEEIQAAFSDAWGYWQTFDGRRTSGKTPTTTLTREAWIGPLLERLGFELEPQRRGLAAAGQSYVISHRAGPGPGAPPVHVVASDASLDRRPERGGRSPHAAVQEFLNVSDELWAIVTNGRRLRILRATNRLAHPAYVEFDLEAIVRGNRYHEFVLLYRLLHRTRFPTGIDDAAECLLETYYRDGIDEGARVREHLREGVEEALRQLGSGLLSHPESAPLRDALESGRLDEMGFYRELLVVVYRLLFLIVGEERRLLANPEASAVLTTIYRDHYSVAILRDRAEHFSTDDAYDDLWRGLKRTFAACREPELAEAIGLSPIGGGLFAEASGQHLGSAECRNAALLQAIRALTTFENRGVRRRVNFSFLDAEELGSVYESLLDYQPIVDRAEWSFGFSKGGVERKTTGSYYTPSALVQELIESALVPVMAERLAQARGPEAKREALLALTVCDPAAGSGHFLLAAARRIARELAKIESGEAEPAPEAFRDALRQVIRRCLYAVDKNALAVDLCKVALWIEGHSPGLPLSFLDHHIRHGDALVGVYDLEVLQDGIPDKAYAALHGDDKAVAKALRAQNKGERAGQLRLDSASLPSSSGWAAEFAALAATDDQSPADVHAKEQLYQELRAPGTTYETLRRAADLWTHAFFAPLQSGEAMPTTADVRTAVRQPTAVPGRLADAATAKSTAHPFFHWPLEFPEIWEAGGFDVVLGNPPWEQIQPEEIKFFAAQGARAIADLPGARRKKAIAQLPDTDPVLAAAWQDHQRDIAAQTSFARASARFPLSAVGKINTYPLFAELGRTLTSDRGRTGLIVPTGIATDDTRKHLFEDFVARGSLVSLFDFENRKKIFPGIDSRIKFSLLTLAGGRRDEPAEFAFFLFQAADLLDADRRFSLTTDDFALLNPNTHTCPIFPTRRDVAITRGIYERMPILIDKSQGDHGNPWGVSFRQGLFNMTSDSGLFHDAPGPGLVSLYEAKMIHQFDHRFGTYDGQTDAQANRGKLPELTDQQHEDTDLESQPRYWVPESEVGSRLEGRWERGWLLGWRDICRSTDARTVIASVMPRVGVGNKIPLFLMDERRAQFAGPLVANLCAFALDYVARQKIGGTTLNFFIVEQLPVLPPGAYDHPADWDSTQARGAWLAPRVLELTYTAWDLQPFAEDCGYDGPPFRWDPARRFLLRCELDAAFFHLYGINRDDVAYILDTFPGVKGTDEAAHGEYRIRRVILEIYDAMAAAMASGTPYQTRLDPPPADPRVAHEVE